MEKHTSFESSFEHLNSCLESKGYPKLSESRAKTIWGIVGDESIKDIIDLVNEYDNEMQFEKEEANNAWRYEV